MALKLTAAALLLAASIGASGPAPAPLPGSTIISPVPGEPEAMGNRQRGVALGLFAEDVGFSYAPLLAEIVALGATHVALVVPLYQTDGSSDDLHLHTRFSPTLEVVADTIRAAQRDRLVVSLCPIVRLSAPRPGEWRGTLAPANRDRWFRRYADLLGDLAAVAAVTGTERLVIGSELSSLDGDLARWRPLLERIRGVFKGTLSYSANWDHYREAALLELVDEEGIAGYFNLRPAGPAAPDEVELEASWRRVKDELVAWRAQRRRVPFVFSEIGYRSRVGGAAAPWDEAGGGVVDLEEQRRAFAAFRRVWAGAPSLDGVYIWNWYGYGGAASRGYTPRGKPAEIEIKALLKQL
jgi:hypothetical protein